MVEKLIVCLANSRKDSGRCVAGVELGDGPMTWIRPVSDIGSGQLLSHHRQYTDGSEPQLLDIVRVGLLQQKPEGYQTENWLIVPESRSWVNEGRVTWRDLATLARTRAPLWVQPNMSSDRLTLDYANSLTDSICLIRPENAEAYVRTSFRGNRQHRISFTHVGTHFDLVATDPWFESTQAGRNPGDDPVQLGPCYLTISLSHPYGDGNCYKLVAAVLTRDRVEHGG